MEESKILLLNQISKVYRMGDNQLYALNDINLTIKEGEFIVILGPSGSGKTTLLNILGGTDRPTSGTMLFKDRDLSQASDYELTMYRRNQIGFIFQFYNLLPTLTAIENIEVAAEIAKNPLAPKEVLKIVGLEGYAKHFPAQMSGGQQQRVAIARALVGDPSILLCDEPTGALDSKTGQVVIDLLKNLSTKLHKTVLFVTHNRNFTDLGDRVIELKDGKVEIGSNA
ncbi:MAG: ABC transporter ATP-binding protein [Gammaproteobacteria bacterium]|nr:ABC transporter ATP-binding protein [Gammaproteobacteria bacterium]